MLKTLKINTSNKIGFIKFTSHELSAICPINGKPDNYDLEIEFTPNHSTIEVSTLREFVLSFQHEKILAEDLTDKICNELYEVLKPHRLSIKLTRSIPEYGIGIEIFQQLKQGEKS